MHWDYKFSEDAFKKSSWLILISMLMGATIRASLEKNLQQILLEHGASESVITESSARSGTMSYLF
jgi:hypothetical protein